MKQYGFYYDAENCVGCRTCQVACKNVYDLPIMKNFRTVRTFATGNGYTPRLYHLSMSCNHCVKPSCVPVCALGALYRDDLGLIVVDEAKCNGCGDCIDACAYAAITLLDSGKAGKCEGCASLRAKGEEVACVASCPQRVLEFKEVDDIKALHGDESLVANAAPLPDSSKQQPNVLMRIKDCMNDKDYDEIII